MANLTSITKTKLFNLLLSGLIILTSILHSYILYILFLCFFTSYILKIIYFLFPLFITTSLLLISLVTAISPRLVKDSFFGTKTAKLSAKSLLYVYDVISKLWHHKTNDEDEDVHSLEALEMYKIVFNTSMFDEQGNHVDVSEKYPEEKILQTVESSELKISEDDKQDCSVKTKEALKGDIILGQDPSIDDSQRERPESIKSVIKKFEDFMNKPETEFTSCNEEIKNVQTKINQTFDEQSTERYDNSRRPSISKSKNSQSMRQSTIATINKTDTNMKLTSKDEIFRQPKSDLGRYGSMRKEREWRSTLACKLFEEKHNSSNIEGIEGMDSLWEKYDEGGSTNGNTKKETKKIDSSKFKNVKYEYGEDEEDEDEFVGHMCCLHAFKLSTTKMNLGVGRRNLAKITKAVKGFGWMHKARKHSKKVHNNNG